MSTIKQEAIKVSSGRVLLRFIEVTFDGIVYKFVNNPVDVGAYNASNFKFVIPNKSNDYDLTTQLVIDNIDRVITSKIRSVLGETIPVKLWYAFSDTPTTYEVGAYNMRLSDANITAQTITLSAYTPNILQNQLTGFTMNTEDFPGLGYV